jgi:peptidoglycan hydrolase CwlO-like protein
MTKHRFRLKSRIRNLEDIEKMQKRMLENLEKENQRLKSKTQRYDDHMYLLQAFIRESTRTD